LKLAENIGKDRFFALNYESLISHPEAIIKQLCAFLDIAYNENMLCFYNSNESKTTAAAGEMWQNLEKPIMRNNTGKFLKELTTDEIELFEMINKSVLTKLAYPLITGTNNISLLSPGAIEQYHVVNAQLKKQAVADARQSDLDKRDLQLQIIKSIKETALKAVAV